MQFTGLHDKNGKEIYEGDIVKLQPIRVSRWYKEQIDRAFVLGVVKWIYTNYYVEQKTEYCLEEIKDDNYQDRILFYEDDYECGSSQTFQWEELEIVGNIYENPELVKNC
jgi:uncharacterized phage protein (TIGR01671 family)